MSSGCSGLVEREIGVPDLVVYNASGRARGAFTDLVPADVAQGDRGLGVRRLSGGTAGGTAHAAQQARRHPVHRRVRLRQGYAQSAPFAMGKFALRGLAQSMARELSPQGIHIAHFVIDGGIRSPARTEPADPPGLDARSRRHCIELLECAATAAQRLELGAGTAAVGREVLRLP